VATGTTADSTAAKRRHNGDTRTRILDIAERLVQIRGFNAFSYADIAAELGITKASLHYHFPGKAELGEALVARYTERFGAALSAIEQQDGDAPARLEAYSRLYLDVLRGRRMCLCGMLAAEYQTLPRPMQGAVDAFFAINETWLEATLKAGRRERTLAYRGSAREAARMIVSGLQGAMLIARPHGDLTGFRTTARTLLASITRPGA